ncbi:MAG TPA: hypothetical protein VFA11_10470 [Acidimicrobiales bacterium]|nr:hypothetical protein [Acidimicrobiales bacterium]
MTEARSEAQRRHAAMLHAEAPLWRDWQRGLGWLAAAAQREAHRRARWERRIARAMRGVSAEAWWGANTRIEAGELSAGPSPQAQRVARVVHVTRSEVLGLISDRDQEMAKLAVVGEEAEAALRVATRGLVEVFGPAQTAEALGLPLDMVRTLCSARPLSSSQTAVLRRAY